MLKRRHAEQQERAQRCLETDRLAKQVLSLGPPIQRSPIAEIIRWVLLLDTDDDTESPDSVDYLQKVFNDIERFERDYPYGYKFFMDEFKDQAAQIDAAWRLGGVKGKYARILSTVLLTLPNIKPIAQRRLGEAVIAEQQRHTAIQWEKRSQQPFQFRGNP